MNETTNEELAANLGISRTVLYTALAGPFAGLLRVTLRPSGGRSRAHYDREELRLLLRLAAERVAQLEGAVTTNHLARHFRTTWNGANAIIRLVRDVGIVTSHGVVRQPHSGRRPHLYDAQELCIGLELLADVLAHPAPARLAA